MDDRIQITRLLLEDGGVQKYLDELDENSESDESSDLPTHQGPRDHNEQILDFIARIVEPCTCGINKASVEMVKLLLSYCSDLNQLDKQGRTILHRVCYLEEVEPEKVKAIIQGGVTIDTLTSESSHGRLEFRTALNFACRDFHLEVIRALLEKGARAQGASAYDITGKADSQAPLVHAAPTPLYDALDGMNEFLFRYPVERDEFDDGRWDELKGRILESIKVLIDHGLSEQQGMLGENHNVLLDIPFACAQLRVDSEDLWSLLFDRGVLDVHRRDQFGQTFLAQLVSRFFRGTRWQRPFTKPNLLRALIKAGSDPNTVDDSGMTPLHWAVFYCDLDIVKILLDGGANPGQEVNGATAVHHAFGKPFARRGPIMIKAMALLQRSVLHVTDGLDNPGRVQAFSQYRKRMWHPILSIASDPVIRKKRLALSNQAPNLMFPIMALLWPFREVAKDNNGHTPRDIAVNVGLLKENESLEVSSLRSRYNVACTQMTNGEMCHDLCALCWTLPRPVSDKGVFENRDGLMETTLLITDTENGQIIRTTATMACFR
ncbi:ankyrin repeat-containing domain protein [Nemania serpens]|nr:ankyrin repeat-containing domain protein [Nemania serpens]